MLLFTVPGALRIRIWSWQGANTVAQYGSNPIFKNYNALMAMSSLNQPIMFRSCNQVIPMETGISEAKLILPWLYTSIRVCEGPRYMGA